MLRAWFLRQLRRVDALPRHLPPDTNPQLSGIGCPDCPGALEVRAIGEKGALEFRCRIGHLFTAKELIETKEEKLEARFWAVVEALDELVALLRDLEAHAARHGRDALGGPYDLRIQRAEAHARLVRGLIEQNEPVTLQQSGSDGAV